MMMAEIDLAAIVRAIKAGAADVIATPIDEDKLLAAVHAALAAQRDASGRDATRQAARARIARLTRRERDVLEGMVQGAANKVIAHALGISPRTVEIHRAKVMDKLGSRSLSQIVRLAVSAENDAG